MGGNTHTHSSVVTGLNGLKGFNITSFNLMSPKPDGIDMNGTVYIPNPSVLTVAMVGFHSSLYQQEIIAIS